METIDRGYQAGNSFKNLVREVKREDIDKKFQAVPNRPTPTEEEQKTLKMLDERWSLAKNAKMKRHDIWNFSYLQYRSVNYYSMLYGGFPTYWNSWGMGVFIPRTFETIESMKVQMMGTEPDFSLEPTTPAMAQEQNYLQHITQSEWKRCGIQTEIGETVHDCLVYGLGIIRTDVINKKKQEYTMSWQDDGSIKYELETVQKYFGVGGHRVDPYDFFPNPSPEVTSIDDDEFWCFERSVVDAWDLRETYRILAENGALGVTANWQYIVPGGDTTNMKYLRQEVDSLYNTSRGDQRYPATINDLVGRTSTMLGLKMQSESKDKVELRDYWEGDRHIVESNGLILLDSPNPFPHKRVPYCKFNCVNSNEFFSMGVPEYMRWLQIAENILYDQGLNNIVMSVHKMFAVNSRYLEDEGELVVRPFGIIHLKQIPNMKLSDAIMPIEFNKDMSSYFQFMEKNTDNLSKVSGVSQYQTGGDANINKNDGTATAANRLAFAGASRISEVSRHLEDDLVKNVVEHFVANIQFYYQNTSSFDGGNLPVKVKNSGDSFWLKYLPSKTGEITQEDRDQAKQEGYRGIVAQDEIQGHYAVTVKGGSSMPVDPDKKRKSILAFATFAQTANTSSTQQVPDPKNPAQMISQTVQTPVFDFKKIALQVAQEVFDIPDPQAYAYNPESTGPGAGPTVDGGAPAPSAELPTVNAGGTETPTAPAQ